MVPELNFSTRRRHRMAAAILSLGIGVAPVAATLLSTTTAFAKAPESVADLAASVDDAVVNIAAMQTDEKKVASAAPALPHGTPLDDLFEEFSKKHGQDEAPRSHKGNSLGSGFVIDPSGIIVTNNHVIADANDITIAFTDGTKLKAEIIGKDAKIDIAVLRVKPKKPLKSVNFGDSDKMRVGDWVMAVGNPFGLGGTVTAGIISAKNRNIDSGPYDNFLQTDASINKGNSGGPLFNLQGEVIGINTAILSPSGGSIGIGFATPSATAVPIIDELRQFGEARRGWLGVRIQNVDDEIAASLNLGEARGALVAGVEPTGPSGGAGIKTGDLIVKFDGKPIKESRDLPKLVASTPVGREVDVTVLRGGKEVPLKVKLGRLPEDKQASLEVPKPQADTPVLTKALGMNLSKLDDVIRKKLSIKSGVKGVVVVKVDPNSPAQERQIKPGDVIQEVNQEAVTGPDDLTKKLESLKSTGKKTALLLVSDASGGVRFVALPID